MKKTSVLVFASLVLVLASSGIAHSQAALFVLIFGDKVASEKFHLSLDAGVNISQMPGLNNGEVAPGVFLVWVLI